MSHMLVNKTANKKAEVQESYKYKVFGTVTIIDTNGEETNKSKEKNRYMFTGREYESEIKLYYYRSRMYSSREGRFLSHDPLRYIDGLNLYEYVRSNPAKYIDPFGLTVKSNNNPDEETAIAGMLNSICGEGKFSFKMGRLVAEEPFCDIGTISIEKIENQTVPKNNLGYTTAEDKVTAVCLKTPYESLASTIGKRKGCGCICRAIASDRDIIIDIVHSVPDISQKATGGQTEFTGKDAAFMAGVGSSSIISIENINRWWATFEVMGVVQEFDKQGKLINERQVVENLEESFVDWQILIHELCGHAVPAAYGEAIKEKIKGEKKSLELENEIRDELHLNKRVGGVFLPK